MDEKYKNLINNIEFIELKRKQEGGLKWKKIRDFRVKFKYNWMVMKSGFYYGGLSGAALGVVFGIPTAIKHGQVSILIASILISGGTFSCIGGFGSMLRD